MINRFLAKVDTVDKETWDIKFTVAGLFDEIGELPTARRMFNTTREVLEDDIVVVYYSEEDKDVFLYHQLYEDNFVGLKFDKALIDLTDGTSIIASIDEDKTKFEMTDSEIKFSVQNGIEYTFKDKFEVKNQQANLGNILDSLMQQLISAKTVGSPGSHTMSPDFIAQVQQLKQKLGMVMEV